MKRLIIAAMLTLASATAMAEWVSLGSIPLDGVEFYAKPETKKRDGHIVRVWMLTSYSKPKFDGDKAYSSDAFQMQYNCKDDLSRIMAIISYSDRLGLGSVVANHTYPNDTWVPVPPSDGSLALLRYACAK